MLAQDSTIESHKILHITKTKMWQLTHCPKNTPIKCHLFSGRNVLGWNCRAEMQHILQQIDETTSNQEPENCHSVFRYHKVIVAKRKNCVCSTMNLPHCTDCNMATDMMWSAKNLPHAKHMYGIWHNWYANLVATLCSQFATLSYLQNGNRQCVHILFATWIYYPSGNRHTWCAH